ncbi:MAG: peptide-binding protein [Phycisphaeraceae bacterium]|nr:peptide-binding protein [Phycisphaeraceae bacterium]
MDQRFGFKDFVLLMLIVALLVSVWLAMKQYDRQWDQLQQIQATQKDQATELKHLSQLLSDGKGHASADLAEQLRQLREQMAAAQTQPAAPEGISKDQAYQEAFARIFAPRKNADFSAGDWYVDAFGAAVGKLTPLVSTDAYGSLIQGYVQESLASRDPETLEWKPLIAKSWTISDDGLVMTFTLRDDVRFSDGSPLNARDVEFTYHWIMNPKVAAPRDRAYYDKLASVEASDDYHVTFKLKEPYFQGFELAGGMSIFSARYYSQFTEDKFNDSPGLLFGSGPYKLSMDPKEWRPGSGRIELVRNDKYWGAAPAFDRIVYREITDETARLVAFRNGEIDVYNPQPDQYVKLKNDAQLRAEKDLHEYESVAGGYRYVAWNQMRNGKPTFFVDARVRRAMTMLTDRAAMCRQLMVGLATVSSGPFHRLSPQSDPNIQPRPFDPDAAKKLLKEAGYEDRDGDGVIESSDGTPFRFKLIYPSSSTNYQQMAFALKDSYARAGIMLEPDPLEWTIMLQRIDQRDFDAMTLGWTSGVENDPFQIFHSSQIGDGGDNYIAYRNPELDKLIDKARVEMNTDKRMELWHAVHRILHEDQPYTFLWTSKAVIFVDKRMHNVQQLKLGLNSREEWYVPRALQKWGR